MSPELKKQALPISLKNIIRAFWESPLGGPFPRIGKLTEDNSIEILRVTHSPSFEQIDEIKVNLELGTWVIIFTKGLSFDESKKRKLSNNRD